MGPLAGGGMPWTLVPAALVLIAAANIVGGLDPFSYGVTFALVFVWVGLSQPPWTSLRFAVPAAAAYVAPIVVDERPAGDVATVAFVVPVCVGIAEGCGFVAERLRRAGSAHRQRRGRAASPGDHRAGPGRLRERGG